MSAPRVLPRLDSENRFFWTAGAEGQLRFLRCQACSAFIHPPRPVCRRCLSEKVAPEAVAGTGTIDTYTINYQAWRPDLEVPYVIARVAIDGAPGVFLTTNIVGCRGRRRRDRRSGAREVRAAGRCLLAAVREDHLI